MLELAAPKFQQITENQVSFAWSRQATQRHLAELRASDGREEAVQNQERWDDPGSGQVRLHKALAHPIRIHLLRTLSYRDISPSQFARSRGEPVANVTYHFRRLEALGCIRLVRTRPAKGALEHVYRRVGRVVIPDDGGETGRGAAGRTTRRTAEPTWRQLVLDERGWLEVSGILKRAGDALTEVEAGSLSRLLKSQEDSILATIALFACEGPV